ncbi:MAG TPA: hypothetical protein VFA97_05280 [Gaiellaceae bacterium]|nr:hypothetical protein [Gaiellaceae bacterium]
MRSRPEREREQLVDERASDPAAPCMLHHRAAPQFAECRRLARIDDRVGLSNQEQGLPLLLCRPIASWRALWPGLRHYD